MIEYRVIDHFALWYFSVERCLNDMAQQELLHFLQQFNL